MQDRLNGQNCLSLTASLTLKSWYDSSAPDTHSLFSVKGEDGRAKQKPFCSIPAFSL